MKKIFTVSLIIILSIGLCKAQYVTIPDNNFATWLQGNPTLSACMNGNQLDTTCSAVLTKKTINCSNKGIADLTGLQYFKNLDTLICYANEMISLPPLPSTLVYLNTGNCRLTSLPQLPV